MSHIRIKIPQEPRERKVDQFSVTLNKPRSPDSILGEFPTCSVTVTNDISEFQSRISRNDVK